MPGMSDEEMEGRETRSLICDDDDDDDDCTHIIVIVIKVRFSLCFFFFSGAPRLEGVFGSGGIAPSILHSGTRWR
jgi:hypothetical protein